MKAKAGDGHETCFYVHIYFVSDSARNKVQYIIQSSIRNKVQYAGEDGIQHAYSIYKQ